jgi:hypothetical protein
MDRAAEEVEDLPEAEAAALSFGAALDNAFERQRASWRQAAVTAAAEPVAEPAAAAAAATTGAAPLSPTWAAVPESGDAFFDSLFLSPDTGAGLQRPAEQPAAEPRAAEEPQQGGVVEARVAEEEEGSEAPLPEPTAAELRLLHWHWANLEYGCSAPLHKASTLPASTLSLPQLAAAAPPSGAAAGSRSAVAFAPARRARDPEPQDLGTEP